MARFGLGQQRNVFSQVAAAAAVCLAVGCLLFDGERANAQFGGGGQGGGGQGGGPNTMGTGATSGVAVDANGVLQRVTVPDPTGALSRQRVQQALNRLDNNIARPSKLRKVSLTRLERLLQKRIADGQPIDDEMQHLAGLTRLQYVFCYPESGDIVVAGPAEAWGEAPSGRILGIDSGRPVLELQDLAVALRAFPPGKDRDKPFIYCSIDPTAEGLARMQEFLRAFGRNATPNDTQFIVSQLQDRLGLQVITVGGVSPKSHFAQVLVEADYRMKLIGIGLEDPPVRLKSYVERANPAQVTRNALQRWYFVPDYQCVRVSDDALAMQLVGNGVKLVGESEVVGKDGQRNVAAKGNAASEAFVKAFTQVYPQLAERAPVYAQLRNCIDLAVAAAFIQHQDYYEAAHWNADTLRNENAYPVETLNPPMQVATAVNSLWKGNNLLTPVGGGVQMRPTQALNSENVLNDEDKAVAKARTEVDLSKLRPDQWWWD
jgi:hypothetical protein